MQKGVKRVSERGAYFAPLRVLTGKFFPQNYLFFAQL